MSTVKGKTSGLTIGVIGLGYVGLPLAVAFAEAGDRVIALDTDIRKIAFIGLLPSRRLQSKAKATPKRLGNQGVS